MQRCLSPILMVCVLLATGLVLVWKTLPDLAPPRPPASDPRASLSTSVTLTPTPRPTLTPRPIFPPVVHPTGIPAPTPTLIYDWYVRPIRFDQNQYGCVAVTFNTPVIVPEREGVRMAVQPVEVIDGEDRIRLEPGERVHLMLATARQTDRELLFMWPERHEGRLDFPVSVMGFVFLHGTTIKSPAGDNASYSLRPYILTAPVPYGGDCISGPIVNP